MKLAMEKTTSASRTTAVTAAMISAGLLLELTGAAREAETAFVEGARRAEEDAAIDAEDILMQAQEANALDPVG